MRILEVDVASRKRPSTTPSGIYFLYSIEPSVMKTACAVIGILSALASARNAMVAFGGNQGRIATTTGTSFVADL